MQALQRNIGPKEGKHEPKFAPSWVSRTDLPIYNPIYAPSWPNVAPSLAPEAEKKLSGRVLVEPGRILRQDFSQNAPQQVPKRAPKSPVVQNTRNSKNVLRA